MFQRCLLSAALALTVPLQVRAQDSLPQAVRTIRPGRTLRIHMGDGRRLDGRFDSLSQVPLGLSIRKVPAPITLAGIDSLWVRGNAAKKGALIGGLALGIPSAAFWTWVCIALGEGQGCDAVPVVAGLTVAGAAVGAGLGAAIGSATSRWQLRYVRSPSRFGWQTPPDRVGAELVGAAAVDLRRWLGAAESGVGAAGPPGSYQRRCTARRDRRRTYGPMNNHAGSGERSHRAVGLLVIVLAVGWGPQATAQATDSLRVGARVQVRSLAMGTFVGEVHSLSSDSLTVRLRDDLLSAVPWSSLSSVQVSTGRRSHAAVGALVGFAVGTALAGYLACCTEYEDPGSGTAFAIGVALFGLPGAGLGAVVGSQIRTDVWRDVPLPTRR